jgi:hypothetical protein
MKRRRGWRVRRRQLWDGVPIANAMSFLRSRISALAESLTDAKELNGQGMDAKVALWTVLIREDVRTDAGLADDDNALTLCRRYAAYFDFFYDNRGLHPGLSAAAATRLNHAFSAEVTAKTTRTS